MLFTKPGILHLMLAVTCIFAVRPAIANHLMGSDITYRCLGKYKYEVTLIVYRDCKGPLVRTNYQHLNVICNSTRGISSFPLTYISHRDITNVGKNCNVSSLCSGGSFPYGIHEYTFKATIDLIWDSVCTDFTFSWQDDARNALTTAIPYQYFSLYTEATVYLDQDGCNNSPVFTTPATAMVCAGTDFVFNNGALDTIDNDLLTYRLIDPLIGATDPLTYLNPYSATRPLMFLGFPDADAPLPGGFHLDSITGNLTFRPTLVNQVTVLVLEITEWRWDGNTYKKVGVTRRDMQLSVINCDGNKPPIITGNTVNVCAGAPLDILITASDTDAGDSIQISWNGGISGATFTTAGGGVNSDSAWFYWNTQPSDARETPYIFTVIARDNGCPLAGQSVKAFAVKVLPQATASISVNDTAQCITGHSFDFINNVLSGDAAWYLSDGREMHGHHLSGIMFNDSGVYATKLIVVENGGCSDTAETSVIVYPRPDPDFTPVNNFYCTGKSSVVFHPVTPGGVFTGKNITGNTFIPSVTGPDTIHYTVTLNGCTADTIKTTQVYPSPALNLGHDTLLCITDPVILNAASTNSSYLWHDGTTSSSCTVNETGKYWVTVYNSCDTLTDTVTIRDCFYNTVPNVFTPNGDNLNDIFLPHVENATRIYFAVFDRWGEKLFETGILGIGWDGTYRGVLVPDGIYMWVVEIDYASDGKGGLTKAIERGNVTLVR